MVPCAAREITLFVAASHLSRLIQEGFMPSAPGARAPRNIEKRKRKAARKAAPKKASNAVGATIGARQRAKKLANKRRGATKVAATA